MPFYVGTAIALTVNFTDLTGTPVDPATVAIVVLSPAGVSTTYNYPADISKVSTGVYQYPLIPTTAGVWNYEWQGGGNVAVKQPGSVTVYDFPAVQPWTYSGDPTTSPKDEVRFLLGDTNQADQFLLDGEINYAIKLVYGNTPPPSGNYLPAAYCADALIGKFSRMVDKTVGDLHLSNSQRVKQFQTLATKLRTRATLAGVAVYVGGLSIAEKLSTYSDPDLVSVAIKVDGMNDPNPFDSQHSNQTTIP